MSEPPRAPKDSTGAAPPRLLALLDSIDEHLVCYDREWRYTYVNRGAARMLGHSVDELLGRCIWQLFPDAVGNQYYRELHQAFALQEAIRSEHYYAPWDRWFENSIYPTEDGVTVLTIDVTGRKRVERALDTSEAQLRVALRGASAGVWRLDIETGEAFWSDEFHVLYGYDEHTPRSYATWVASVLPEDRESVESALDNSSSRGDTEFQRQFRIVHGQRGTRWILELGRIERGADGRAVSLSGIHLDITERRRAEDTLRSLLQLSSRLNSTLDLDQLLDILVAEAIPLVNAESGVAGVYGPAGMVCHSYRQRGRVVPLEYCWPPMHGLPGWLIVHKKPYLTNDAASDPQIVQELCAQFGVNSALSTPILDREREPLGFFELHNKPGGFSAHDRDTLVAISDIAAIAVQNALAYRRLCEAQQAMQTADRRKDEFLATLAHELRNPLAPIRNGLYIARSTAAPDSPLQRTIAMMERQVTHLVRLVDDLVDVSRITGGKVDLQRRPLSLAEVLARSIEARRSDIEKHGHELVVELKADSLMVDGDFDRLEQVFSNLLSNSAKYTERGGRITLSLEREGDQVLVQVTDTGLGMRPEETERVFEMFTQLPEHKGRTGGGLGIGLSLVRTLVTMHGGAVSASSAGPGAGTTFTVRLPLLRRPPAEQDRAQARDQPSCKPGNLRVLIADDNVDASDSLAALLELHGHHVVSVTNGLEAVERTPGFRPDLILMDIGMPTMDGLEAARRIRSLPEGRNVLIAALTGWGQPSDRERTAASGIDRHLVKPVSSEALGELLSTVMKS